MANLNLSPTSLERKHNELNTIFDQGVVVPLVIIGLTFGLLFGLQFYNSSLEKRVSSIDNQTTKQKALLSSDSIDRVVGFDNRLKQIETKFSSKEKTIQDAFAAVEKLMVFGVSLDAYRYDITNKTISLKVVANDFKSIAQQAISFKSSDTFSGVTVSDTAKNDTGAITSQMVIGL
jgi:hypothetical protein